VSRRIYGSQTSANKIYLLRPGSLRCHPVLGHSAPKIADKAQAGRLFCALPRGAAGTKMACGEDATTHFRQVNPTLGEHAQGDKDASKDTFSDAEYFSRFRGRK